MVPQVSPSKEMRRPTGSSSPKCRRARLWLTTMTSGSLAPILLDEASPADERHAQGFEIRGPRAARLGPREALVLLDVAALDLEGPVVLVEGRVQGDRPGQGHLAHPGKAAQPLVQGVVEGIDLRNVHAFFGR